MGSGGSRLLRRSGERHRTGPKLFNRQGHGRDRHPCPPQAPHGGVPLRDELSKLMDTIDALAEDPRPAEAVAFGPNVCRLYVGHYRVTDDVTATQVRIGHITCVL